MKGIEKGDISIWGRVRVPPPHHCRGGSVVLPLFFGGGMFGVFLGVYGVFGGVFCLLGDVVWCCFATV
jgi:hypothetical protein